MNEAINTEVQEVEETPGVCKIEVRTDLIEDLNKRIERRLNKPARKLGLPEIVVTQSESFRVRYVCREELGYGIQRTRCADADFSPREESISKSWTEDYEFATVTITGFSPVIAGWEFVAVIEHTENGNILRVTPNHEEILPVEYRNSDRDCDHCGYVRNRKDTYVIRNEDGEYKQVGRQCLRDFLGHVNPDQIATYFDNVLSLFVADWVGGESWGSAPATCDIEAYLAVVAESVVVNGWLSKGAAYNRGYGYATAILAWDYLMDLGRTPAHKWIETFGFDTVGDENVLLAQKALAWIRDLDISDDPHSDYLHNLKVSCAADYVTFRRSGIIGSVIQAFNRATAKQDKVEEKIEREKTAEEITEYNGQRIEITGTVISGQWRDTGFGSAYKIVLETTWGFRLWGTAAAKLVDDDGGVPKAGDVITFTAKIAASDDDKFFGFYSRPSKAQYVSRVAVTEVA